LYKFTDGNLCDWWIILKAHKAFDVVNHAILLSEQKYYGIQGKTGFWFKVAGSIPNEVIGFFSIDLILPATLGPGVYSASNRNEYQELIK
jgi:hypothetical protein